MPMLNDQIRRDHVTYLWGAVYFRGSATPHVGKGVASELPNFWYPY